MFSKHLEVPLYLRFGAIFGLLSLAAVGPGRWGTLGRGLVLTVPWQTCIIAAVCETQFLGCIQYSHFFRLYNWYMNKINVNISNLYIYIIIRSRYTCIWTRVYVTATDDVALSWGYICCKTDFVTLTWRLEANSLGGQPSNLLQKAHLTCHQSVCTSTKRALCIQYDALWFHAMQHMYYIYIHICIIYTYICLCYCYTIQNLDLYLYTHTPI